MREDDELLVLAADDDTYAPLDVLYYLKPDYRSGG